MRKIYTIFMLCVGLVSANAQTTQEEYNYITKGYKRQIDEGLDMKKGYRFKDLFNDTGKTGVVTRTVYAKALYRDKEDIPCAILLYYGSTGGFSSDAVYFCIPHYLSDESIWDSYREAIARAAGRNINISYSLARCAAYFAQNN